jgi:hypothetical protein
MNTDLDKVFLTLRLEFTTVEDALMAKKRLGEYFKNIQLNVTRVNYKRKLERYALILENLYRFGKPIRIGALWRLALPGISYKQFSRDVSELILKGEIFGKRKKGGGGNTTILWVRQHEGIADKH